MSNGRITACLASRAQNGMTLIELMISMLLGLLVVGGVLGVFMANGTASRRTNDLASLQESARAAFEFMGRSIREADGNVCGIQPKAITLVTGLDSSDWWTGGVFFENAIKGYKNGASFPAGGTITKSASSDAIILISASDGAIRVTQDNHPDGPLILQSATPFSKDQILFGCSNSEGKGQLFKAGTVDQTAKSIAHAGGLNAMDSVAKVNAEGWFVGNNTRGGSSLFRTALNSAPEEIAPDVAQMKLSFLARGENDYKDADAITTGNLWEKVVAVRIELAIEKKIATGETIRYMVMHTAALRNRSLLP